MLIKQRVWWKGKKREWLKRYYDFMKPLANYLDKRDNKRRERIQKKSSIEDAVKILGKVIIKKLVKRPSRKFYLMDAMSVPEEISHYKNISDVAYMFSEIKGKKSIVVLEHLKYVDLTEKVVEFVRKQKGVVVEEKIEDFSKEWYSPMNYKKSYIIRLDIDK